MVLSVAAVAAAAFGGCGHIRHLSESDPEVGLRLPARSSTPEELRADTMRAPKIITFRKQDGTELFLAPVAVDTLTGEKMMSVAIDEVVISASNRRNLVERNGKINVDFIVTVPEALQHKNWQLAVDPLLQKGSDTLTLDPLFYNGAHFRAMQQRQYRRYASYVDRIVDSADYFDRFGDRKTFEERLDYAAARRTSYASGLERLANMEPAEAKTDPQVGWLTRRERERQMRLLRKYVRATDRKVARMVTYVPDRSDRFDHLNDYFAPRYRFEGVDVLPGGEIYTRVEGEYPDAADRDREAYLQRLAAAPAAVRYEVSATPDATIGRLANERLRYTGFERPLVVGLLRSQSDSAARAEYNARRYLYAGQAEGLEHLDTAALKSELLDWGKVGRNERLRANRAAAYARMVNNPYDPKARLDTVIFDVNGSIIYHYSEQITADENTARLHLFLAGDVEDTGGRNYRLKKSDTLTYNVASMSTFVDERTRYMQRIVLRDAEANARFFFTFPLGKSRLVDTAAVNRRQIAAVRALTRDLMTDPVYIIDSITLRATASPEGSWKINERLARERAEALKKVLVGEFRILYDSLKIAANYTIDKDGRVVVENADDELPDLPNLLRSESLAEDWPTLRRLVQADEVITPKDKQGILKLIDDISNPDAREWRIRARFPKAYARMRQAIYPEMRAVDFRFNLHRRGMKQDTVYTTEVDTTYMRAVELLKKRRYADALEILRPYEDRNTALAYLSLGYNEAAYRILQQEPGAGETADLQYMLAILASRLGDEERAVQYFLRSVELRETLKFRGNLDPEISRLIRKYGLFREDFM